jgi:hypothetical protein
MEKVIYKEVAKTLTQFCKHSLAFAEVVAKTPRTLSDCCAKVVEGADRTGISDLLAYQKAVKFYFPNSEVLFHMEIRHTGDAPSEEEINKPAEKPESAVKSKGSNSSQSQVVKPASIHLDLFADEE